MLNKDYKNARCWIFDENSVLPFGKHKGKTILHVFNEDASYIGYCIREINQFCLRLSAFKVLKGINKAYWNDQGDLYVRCLNKALECNRFLRRNTVMFQHNRSKIKYFENQVVGFKGDKVVVLRLEQRSVGIESGGKVHVIQEELCSTSCERRRKLTEERENRIYISLQLVDYKDIKVFRKYENAYSRSTCKVFEYVKALPAGLVVLVMVLDLRGYRPDSLDGGSQEDVEILPDDAACIVHILNAHYTQDVEVGVRAMTKEENDAAWYPYDPEAEYDLYEDGGEENFSYPSTGTLPIYGEANLLDKLLNQYSINRQAFPDLNLFNDTDLHNEVISLNFALTTEEICALTKQWYESDSRSTEFERRQEKVWSIHLAKVARDRAYCHDSEEHSSLDQDNWDARTDGQYGSWEDRNRE